jgi:hypothetical protein
MEKYPEWLKLRPEMPGFWEVIIRGNVEERHPLYPAPDHAGQSLAPRNGWESYDWMHYTPREKVLFGVEDTGWLSSNPQRNDEGSNSYRRSNGLAASNRPHPSIRSFRRTQAAYTVDLPIRENADSSSH